MACSGVGNACLWAPLARPRPATCRSSWPAPGSGVYNATRQVGAVLGSAAIAVLMTPGWPPRPAVGRRRRGRVRRGALPPQVRRRVRDAMAQSLLLPAGVLLLGFVAVLFFERPRTRLPRRRRPLSAGPSAPSSRHRTSVAERRVSDDDVA